MTGRLQGRQRGRRSAERRIIRLFEKMGARYDLEQARQVQRRLEWAPVTAAQ